MSLSLGNLVLNIYCQMSCSNPILSMPGSINAQTSEQKIHQDIPNDDLMPESRNPENGSVWVDVFVQEMMNASNRDDVRNCTIKTLEAFQRSVLDRSATSKEVCKPISLWFSMTWRGGRKRNK